MSNIDACQDSFKKIIQLAADALREPPGIFMLSVQFSMKSIACVTTPANGLK